MVGWGLWRDPEINNAIFRIQLFHLKSPLPICSHNNKKSYGLGGPKKSKNSLQPVPVGRFDFPEPGPPLNRNVVLQCLVSGIQHWGQEIRAPISVPTPKESWAKHCQRGEMLNVKALGALSGKCSLPEGKTLTFCVSPILANFAGTCLKQGKSQNGIESTALEVKPTPQQL